MTEHENKNNDSIDSSDNTNPIKRVENSWILLVKESLLANSEFNFISFPHPAHNKPTKFCLDQAHKKIYEMVTLSEPHRCWFFGLTVKSDSSMLFLTPVNPIFLVLPYLRKQCNTRAMPLKDLSSNKGFEKVVDFVNNLDLVADSKGPSELKAYKYNESKTLMWLENKMNILAKIFQDKNIHVTPGAVSATFVASDASSNSVDEDLFLKYAFGMITEYVESDIIDLLKKKLNLKADFVESLGQKRKTDIGESYNKRIKFESNGIESTNSASAAHVLMNGVIKPKILSAKEKARQRAASGTKTISAFFTKK